MHGWAASNRGSAVVLSISFPGSELSTTGSHLFLFLFLFLLFFSLSVRFIPVFLHQTNRIHSAAAEGMSRI